MDDDTSSGLLTELARSDRPHVVIDREGVLRHVGLAAFAFFGRSPLDIDDLAALFLLRLGGDEEDRERLRQALASDGRDLCLEAGGSWIEFRTRPMAMDLRILDWSDEIRTNPAGPAPTDSELLDEILAQVDHGIILYDRDPEGLDVVRLFNKRAEDLLELPEGFMRRGRRRDEIVRQCVERGDYGEAFDGKGYFKQVQLGHEMRTTGRRPSGRFVESLSRHRADGRGSLALNFDVSQQVAQLNRIKDAEEHYRLLAESAPTGILKLDGTGTVSFVNDAALHLLGRAAEEIDLFAQLLPTDGKTLCFHLDNSATFDAEIRRNAEVLHVMVSVAQSHRHRGARIITLADFTALREAQRQIEHLARHDPLTGLGNRSLFSLRWAAIETSDTDAYPAHLIALDLDRFKLVNDDHGHHVGDLLLKAVATRLTETVGLRGEIFRLGGDEFSVIVTDASRGVALDIAKAIVERLAAPFQLSGVTALIGCSAGVASMPLDGMTSGDVQKAADVALYNVKRNGRNGYACYDPTQAREINEQRRLASDLALALAGSEFSLMYQPVFDLEGGRITRVEALLRWYNRRLGTYVAPDAIFRLAEEASLVTIIDFWVMRTAVAQLRAFIDAGIQRPALSINMSKVTLSRPEVIDRIREALAEHRIAPDLLEIEVKHGSGRHDLETIRSTLLQIREIGITVALDDFGTGDTALATLRILPFDRVKLDRTIVEGMGRDIDADAIAAAVLSICRTLDRRMTAEGIETQAQHAALLGLGSIDGQGFFLAPPEPPELTLQRLLAQESQPSREQRETRSRTHAPQAGA